MRDRVTPYLQGMVSGKVPAVRSLRLLAERHLRDLEAAKGDDYPYEFSPAAFERFASFCRKTLVVEDPVKGDGTEIPFELTNLQLVVAGLMFGWVKKENGMRRFTEVHVNTPKGSSKSPLGAAVLLYALVAEGEYEASCMIGARTFKQSGVIAENMGRMIRRSPLLRKHVRVTGGSSPHLFAYQDKRGVLCRCVRLAAQLEASQSGAGLSGPRLSCGVVDEAHEWASSAQLDSMRDSQKNRVQPILMSLTNCGRTLESPAGRLRHQCFSVLEQTLDIPHFLPVVIEADEGTKPFEDESLWPALHLDLDWVIGREELRKYVKTAMGSPDLRAREERLWFGVWAPKAENTLFSLEAWQNVEAEEDFTDKLAGLPMFLGLDLSQTRDVTALAALWVDLKVDSLRIYGEVFPYLPGVGIEARYAQEQVPYHLYAEDGHIHLCDSDRVEYADVAAKVKELMGLYDARVLAYDRWKIEYMVAALKDAGIEFWKRRKTTQTWESEGMELAEHGQGLSAQSSQFLLENSICSLEQWVADGSLTVRKNPLLRYHAVEGSMVEYGERGLAENRRFVRSDKRVVKNDCLVALVMACGAAQRYIHKTLPELREPTSYAVDPSFYDD